MVPEVKRCNVTQCFYNQNNQCNAHAITVGSEQPKCETFLKANSHTQKNDQGEVGACHISQCMYNDSMYCHACDDIVVDWSQDSAMCTTFRPR